MISKKEALDRHYKLGTLSDLEYEKCVNLLNKFTSSPESLKYHDRCYLADMFQKMGDIEKAHAKEWEIFQRQRAAGIKRPVKMHMHIPDTDDDKI